MFKIGSQRVTWVAVKWNGLDEEGRTVANEVDLKVELVDRTQLQEQLRAEREGQFEKDTGTFALQVTRGWRKVADAEGSPLPFSSDNLALLLEAPGFVHAFGQSYLQAWAGESGIRSGNSEPSPAAGPVGEAGDAPEA